MTLYLADPRVAFGRLADGWGRPKEGRSDGGGEGESPGDGGRAGEAGRAR